MLYSFDLCVFQWMYFIFTESKSITVQLKNIIFFFQMKLIAFYNLLETVSRGIPWQLTLPRSKIFPDF